MFSGNNIRICVPVNEKTLSALTLATQKAADVADLIELRIDGLDRSQLSEQTSQLKNLISDLSRPVILTFRPAEQGGYRSVEGNERLRFWENYLDSDAAFFDIELDMVGELTKLDEQPDWSKVICSHHDFDGVPRNLDDLYGRMTSTPARILKLAVKANDVVDCLPVFRLLERARLEGRGIIAIAMGEAGVITRILGPARGSFLTYAAIGPTAGTAPGQLIAEDLRSIYRVDQIDPETMITGLVGLPVAHSVSPRMHNAAFHATGLNGVYLPLHVTDVGTFVTRMVHPQSREISWNLKGLSVTAPHKVAVLDFLDWTDPIAQKIGAVNTVVIENEELRGYNTDAAGFIEPLVRQLGSLNGARAAVIGSGGAASAALFALKEQQVDVSLYARNMDNAQHLAERFNISYQSIKSANFAGVDIVVNATPLGSFGRHIVETPLVADQLRHARLAYDLVYNPIETRFLLEAREAGCKTLGGLEMLVAQAALQFKLWTNANVSYELMYNAGSAALSKFVADS